MRARNKRFIILATQASIDCATGGWDAYGISISNPTAQYLYVPAVNDWIAPQSRGTFALGGDPVVNVQWGAPPGITQPAGVTAPVPQQASCVLTDQPLPNAGGPIVLNPSSLVSWLDGTEALPGLPNSNDLSLGIYRPAPNRLGFSVAGVERFELGVDYARIRDGTAAAPSLGFLLEPTTGISRPGASRFGFSVAGNEQLELTATGGTLAVAGVATAKWASAVLNPGSDAGSDLGASGTRWSQIFGMIGVLGTSPAASGILRVPNGGSGDFNGRNAANTGDVNISRVDGNDVVTLGAGGRDVLMTATLRIGTNPASAGVLRFPNNQAGIRARNAANSADVPLLDVDGSDVVQISPFGQAVQISGNTTFPVSFLSFGTTPATSGLLRVPNAQSLVSRNNANTGNKRLINLGTGDTVNIDEDAGGTRILSTLRIGTLGAFAAGDKYVIADVNGNLHISAIGPAS